MKRDTIFALIDRKVDMRIEQKKETKLEGHVWLSIMLDYLGQAVRPFVIGKFDQEMLINALAIGVAWLEDKGA
jgi:hypothetical protein